MADHDPQPAPGTVSRILWHFTGGPTWNAKTNSQNTRRKPGKTAFNNLVSILRSRELRLGSYNEVVNVIVPEVRAYLRESKEVYIRENVRKQLRSSAVCCLADIPIVHLPYNARRYGKFAIGFHRDSAIKHGLNPVLYTLEMTDVIQTVYAGLSTIEDIPAQDALWAIDDVESAASDLENDDVDVQDVESAADDVRGYVDEIESAQRDAVKSIRTLLAFVKTFRDNEFDSIYCEREWRSTAAFSFGYDDLAMIVLPKSVGRKEYFGEFCAKVAPSLKLPRSLPIVPWEDLVEH